MLSNESELCRIEFAGVTYDVWLKVEPHEEWEDE